MCSEPSTPYSDARETILDFLVTTLRLVPGVALVTRFDHRAIIGKLSEWPAICVVDMGDEVGRHDQRRTNERHLDIALVAAIKGTSEDLTPTEMGEFQALVRKQFYGSTLPKRLVGDAYFPRCSYIDDSKPLRISPLAWTKVGSLVAVQGQEFRILYQEIVQDLFADLLPTL
jgi:hypothetical protein